VVYIFSRRALDLAPSFIPIRSILDLLGLAIVLALVNASLLSVRFSVSLLWHRKVVLRSFRQAHPLNLSHSPLNKLLSEARGRDL